MKILLSLLLLVVACGCDDSPSNKDGRYGLASASYELGAYETLNWVRANMESNKYVTVADQTEFVRSRVAHHFGKECVQEDYPDWVRYITVDADGLQNWWAEKPVRRAKYRTWLRNRHATLWRTVGFVEPPQNWRRTLEVIQ